MLKLTFAAAALALGIASASAMPVSNLAGVAPSQTEDVRLVCNRWGRCWRTGPVYGGYRAYGYRGGYRGYRRW